MMRPSLLLALAFSLVVLVALLGQIEVEQSPTPSPTDEWKPADVETPTSDTEAREAGRPLAPQVPGERDATQQAEPLAPSGEISPAEPLAPAQDVPPVQDIAPVQQVPPTPEPVSPVQQISPVEEPLTSQEAVVPTEASRKRWRFTPLFGAGVYYDDNIFLTTSNRVSDVIWTLAGGFAFELGDFRGGEENYFAASWLGTPIFYTDNPEQNSFNQTAALRVRYRWNRLVARLDSSFSIARTGNREVNTITTTKSFSNDLRFTYDYSGKTKFFVGFSQLATIVESFQNNYQYEARAGADYQIFPKTALGFEGVGGVLVSPSSPLQYYEQARLRVNYGFSQKLSFNLSVGVEFRQLEGSGSSKVNPVFSLGMFYQPFDGTTLSIGGYRNVVGSIAQAGQDYVATGFVITAQQRLFQKFNAAISVGFENDAYFATEEEESFSTDREDNYFFLRPSLRYSFVRWVSTNLFYEYRNTASTQATRSFYNNRVGIEISTSF